MAFRFARIAGLFLLLVPFCWSAENHPAAPTSSPPETDPQVLQKHLHQVLARPEFQNLDEPGYDTQLQDLLARWLLTLGSGMEQLKYVEHMQSFISLLTSFFVVLTFAGLVYITIRLFRKRPFAYAWTKTAVLRQKQFQSPEHYEDEIATALHRQNWGEAWLATWRQFLSRLENRQLVPADRTRTNHEYLKHLLQQPMPGAVPPLLRQTVEAYDLYIYGQRPITEEHWQTFRAQLEQASQLLELEPCWAHRLGQGGSA